ncbi:hypothetical protein CQW23_02013 [Capsicum baccatum]|uniref:F-box associated beta-propeller type 1 domain-containing protein n=1 Tax=Capsicum baccatum TaxID=33114 RepID=A0A2G2XQA2_CAPBA|nr:hypothetical protein CQW23_02013 [Capsicum baccatum]
MEDKTVIKAPIDVVVNIFDDSSEISLAISSTFINLHLNANEEFILFKRSYKEEPCQFRSIMSFLSSSHDNDDLRPVSPDLAVPYLSGSSIFHRIIGPCNGLVALTDAINILLFNPATRHFRLLKPSPFGSPLGFCRSINGFAFGFDLIANDHKIVRLAEVHGEPPFYCYTIREWRVEVYELSINTWREADVMDERLPRCVIDIEIDLIEVWVTREYGVNETWCKKYIITPLSIESPLAVWKDHLLLLQSGSGLLISYDLNSDEVKEFNLHGWPRSLRATVYKENMTSIPRGSEHITRVC